MFSRSKVYTDAYYAFWLRVVHLKNKAKLLPVNFSHSWTALILSQKTYLAIAFMCEIFVQTFYTLYPLLLGIIIEKQSYTYFISLISLWLCVIAVEYISVYFNALVEIQCINSIQYDAFLFFLHGRPALSRNESQW